MNLDTLIHARVDRLPAPLYRVMAFLLTRGVDRVNRAAAQVAEMGLKPGMTVVDYGCGPGRFIPALARAVGDAGTVYAADVHELALADVRARVRREGLSNVRTALVTDQHCDLPDRVADVVISFDVVHMVTRRDLYYREMHRILKPDGVLLADSGHLSPKAARAAILESGCWEIESAAGYRFICRPR
ncbi:MAG: class I SAM-dependent methyltransferase [Nitrospirota bacterium]|nr:class I SAM-dependent methyltransferase [Nitrospirota bacterium]